MNDLPNDSVYQEILNAMQIVDILNHPSIGGVQNFIPKLLSDLKNIKEKLNEIEIKISESDIKILQLHQNMSKELTTDKLALLTAKGFDDLYYKIRAVSRTNEEAYALTEGEYRRHFKKNRYRNYDSYRTALRKRSYPISVQKIDVLGKDKKWADGLRKHLLSGVVKVRSQASYCLKKNITPNYLSPALSGKMHTISSNQIINLAKKSGYDLPLQLFQTGNGPKLTNVIDVLNDKEYDEIRDKLPNRCYNILYRNDHLLDKYIEDISKNDFLKCRNAGIKTWEEFEKWRNVNFYFNEIL